MDLQQFLDVVVKVAVVLGIILVGWVLLKRRPPDPVVVEPPADPGDDPCVIPLGINVSTPILAPWWDPSRWPPDHYPAGSTLCFVGLFNDCNPADAIKPALFRYTVIGPFQTQPVWIGQSGPENSACWDGWRFIAGSCGDLTPKPYRVVLQIQLSNGEWLPNVETMIWAVSERACRT